MMPELFTTAWTGGFFLCGVIGFALYELLRGYTGRWWQRSVKIWGAAGYSLTVGALGLLIGFVAGLISAATAGSAINAIIIGFSFVPTGGKILLAAKERDDSGVRVDSITLERLSTLELIKHRLFVFFSA